MVCNGVVRRRRPARRSEASSIFHRSGASLASSVVERAVSGATETGTIVVCGATGRQGRAVVGSLLDSGWTVRAMTRRPDGKRARALTRRGAMVVRGNMDDPASLGDAFEGADGVYSVQNGITSGFDREVEQGRNVAEAAKRAGIRHLVYGSAGPGTERTGVPSWDAKRPVEEHIHRLDIPATILRPLAFMELMTDPSFYPAVGTWRIFPRLTGEDRPIPWLSIQDLGRIAAIVFARPDEFVGSERALASDVRTLAECRDTFTEVFGRSPRTFPLPERLFDRFTRHDVTKMWRWLRAGDVPLDTEPTHRLLPSAMSVREWLGQMQLRETASA